MKAIKFFFYILIFFCGSIYYFFKRKNTNLIYNSYVYMYSLTSGYISFILSNFISLFKKSLPKTPQKNSHDIINQKLINNGYCVLQQEIKNDEVEQLYNLTKI